jgi:glucokinase
MTHDRPVIGVDLGATNMLVAIVDGDHRVLHRHHRTTEGDGGFEHVVDRVVDGIRDTCREADLNAGDIAAAGVAVAGAVDVRTGVVLNAFNLKWSDQPFRARLREKLNVPVAIDNDVNAAAWGEHQLGAGRGHADMFGVWVGTGIGGGVVLNNRLYHGALSTAGEIGQSVSDPYGTFHHRVVEDFGGRAGMKRLFAERFPTATDSILYARTGGDADALVTEDFVFAYEQNDALACEIIDAGALRLGVALANIVSILSLPMIVIGGGITEALGGRYLGRVREAFDGAVFPERGRSCELSMTQLRADAGVLGAALLAREAD